MRSTWRLIYGELTRLLKYKILPVSLATSIIWIIIFFFVSKEDASYIAPLLIFVDISIMSILLIGASHHLEKQEGTINSMLVMPVSMGQILAAKIVSSMVLGIESFVLVALGLFIIHGITFNYALMFLFILIAGGAHAAIGFFLAHNSKDFTSMLGQLMAYMFLFTIPSVLYSFGMIDVKYEWFLMLLPSHSANNLINSAFSNEFEWAKALFGSTYLIILALLLIMLAVYPKFKKNSIRG